MKTATAKRRAIRLMKKHNLTNLGWSFRFDKATKRFGCCNYTRREISLSKGLVESNSWNQVKDTILHEIAHALTPGEQHSYAWKQKAIEIGCNGERCYSSNEVNDCVTKYLYECKGCKKQSSLSRMVSRLKACGDCCRAYNYGKFSADYVLTITKNPAYSGDYKAKDIRKMNIYNERALNYKKPTKSVSSENAYNGYGKEI